MLFLAPLLGAALGLTKYAAFDKPNEKRTREVNSAIARYSPWTGMTPGKEEKANLFGDLLGGAAAGALLSGAFGGGSKGLLGFGGGEDLAAESTGAESVGGYFT